MEQLKPLINIAEIFAGCVSGDIKFVYLLGADEFDMGLLGNSFVVYQGSHGDDGAHRADVIFPAATYTEKEATYVNMEGRVQRTKRAVFPVGQAKEDWKILRALSDVLVKQLTYDSVGELRKRMEQVAPHFAKVGEIVPAQPVSGYQKPKTLITSEPFDNFIINFYMTDPISRASKVMAECTKIATAQQIKKVA